MCTVSRVVRRSVEASSDLFLARKGGLNALRVLVFVAVGGKSGPHPCHAGASRSRGASPGLGASAGHRRVRGVAFRSRGHDVGGRAAGDRVEPAGICGSASSAAAVGSYRRISVGGRRNHRQPDALPRRLLRHRHRPVPRRGRYLDPTLGRFTQLDPSSQSPGYAYAGDDPINDSDPSGYLLDELFHAAEDLATGKSAYDIWHAFIGGNQKELDAIIVGESLDLLVTSLCTVAILGITDGIGLAGEAGCFAAGQYASFVGQEVAGG